MTVRCKFRCVEVTKRAYYEGAPFHYDAKFNPVTTGSEENKQFFAATPGGSIVVQTIKSDVFEPGKEYYVDFTPA